MPVHKNSENYRLISAGAHLADYADAWKHPGLPMRQYEIVSRELEQLWLGQCVAPFRAFLDSVRLLKESLHPGDTVIDIGASTGYYSEVLKYGGFHLNYIAVDYSPAFEILGRQLFPGMAFYIADGLQLPFADDAAELVITGGTLMHVAEYERFIREAVRVAKRWVLFHRTPVMRKRSTRHYIKEAYGVTCLEIHFNEGELMQIFGALDLTLLDITDVFWQPDHDFGHRNYLLRKC